MAECTVRRLSYGRDRVSIPYVRSSCQAHPDDQSTRLVGGADLVVGTLGNMVEEEVQEVFGLFLFVPDDATRESLVDVERLLACDWVDADKGVLRIP